MFRLFFLLMSLICLCGSIEGNTCEAHPKPKYKIIYDQIDFHIDARVVIILDKTSKHYCMYLIDVLDHDFEKLGVKEAMSVGQPVDYDTAKRLVDLEKLGLNQYGF